jgi:hypothetical protein
MSLVLKRKEGAIRKLLSEKEKKEPEPCWGNIFSSLPWLVLAFGSAVHFAWLLYIVLYIPPSVTASRL